ncbi:enterochelin esterase-like enzyme [Paenibacillus turicensis]|uniref:Enterochelin esterase-like enzyme n=1 Tax=Paenibacillus turicensis TaxID=160487 RepID=A0ABS4FPN6_9BACL|nr:alpha/beta hydrolase-fold protein [Paenibacillus turicensis]MBP1904549.1 enterochelin esterase-like enzyme [Paenibacillus turicensis]
MEFINPPMESPENVIHQTYYSQFMARDIGYNIYLPPGYKENSEKYSVSYHLHGWTGNESSEVWTMEKIYKNKSEITVFPNTSPVIEKYEKLPIEFMFINELLPHIESEYKTKTARSGRSISGFSMGAGMAFNYAVKYPELFSTVTAYAGTYHHYYHKDSGTVGADPKKANELYTDMMTEERYFEDGNILCSIRQNAEKIRGSLDINLHIGTDDILFCDNEILHLYLDSLHIPHKYNIFEGAGHELKQIL